MIDIEKIKAFAASVFQCAVDTVHGPGHWKLVENNGLVIAEQTDADITVVRLFAALHDCCRWDDGYDPEHGPRAAEIIEREQGKLFTIQQQQLDILLNAVERHTMGETTDDPTIGTCWDADRLDLGRVSIRPDPQLMSTAPGREIAKLGSRRLYLERLRTDNC